MTKTTTIQIRTQKIPATDSRGARIKVELKNFDNWTGKSYPFDFSAVDPHHAAVAEYVTGVLGLRPPFTIAKGDLRRSGTGYFFTVEA